MTLKQVFIVNKNLGMRTGKISVQVAHGEIFYIEHVFIGKRDLNSLETGKNFLNYLDWRENGLMKKIVLKASQEEMLFLIGALKAIDDDTWFGIVYDIGLTQVPTDSMTCIVFEPLDEEEANERFGYLKLL